MSRLGEHLKLIQMEPATRRFANSEFDPMQFMRVERSIAAMQPPRYETKYELTATAHATLWLDPMRLQDTELWQKQARDCILAEVFGEFRMPLMQARHHLNNGERAEANAIISGILESMFK